ncbi:MAG: class I SAM-dependent methyltransferase [Verrucomicrobia bacterium]|nr:class I SAM-dependent methyltransferase [Verrucomicrobiota bacterium]
MSSLDQSSAEFVSSVRQLIESRDLTGAEHSLRDRIFNDPLDTASFALLAEVRTLAGQVDAARVAERRFRQLQQIAANSKPAHAVEYYEAMCAFSENPADSIELNGFCFAGLRRHESEGQLCAVGCSLNGRAFLKIELQPPSETYGGLAKELKFLQLLSDSGCNSSAQVLRTGTVNASEIDHLTKHEEWKKKLGPIMDGQDFPYVVMAYVRADQGGFGVADVGLALLEQQALGVYQNCVALPRIRFDSIHGICRFTDYRSAIQLEDSVRSLPPRAYLDWCSQREVDRRSTGGPPSFLDGRSDEIARLFEQEDLLLVRTQMFGRQLIADVPVPSVQDVAVMNLKMSGSVRVKDRYALLDKLSFEAGERVLDLGCGAGAISRYIAGRGCVVMGVDCDTRLLIQASLLANIECAPIEYVDCDLEYDFPDAPFDTVLLLAVLSHLSNRAECARRITASGCKRIVIECANKESGYRWQGSRYHPVDGVWNFENTDALQAYMKELFPDFKTVSELGITASNRCIYLLEKEGVDL